MRTPRLSPATPNRPAARRPVAVAVLAVAPVLALLAACGGASGAAEGGEAGGELQAAAEAAGLEVNTTPDQDRIRTQENPDAIALLPPELAAKDTLTVAVGAFTAPLSFLADDEATPIGNETDLAQLVADALGKDLELEVKAWADWPLALESGDVDAVIANVTVTEERKEKYDFSSYRNDQLGWLVQADSDITAIDEPSDIAGLTVAVGSGTNQEKILLAWDQENQDAGLDPVQVEYFENDGDTILALQSGRIDASFGPNASASYKAEVSPQDFAVVGTLNGGWPDTAQIAVATVKGSGAAEAVTAALQGAFDDGTYQQVLERWGLEEEAVDAPQTNPPGLPKTS
jgi:polar amino acid transport system substrate-binding protein